MAKRRIIVRGNIQGIGYRLLVKRIALAKGIKGMVKNLDDGSVEIYCQATVKDIKDFIKAIDIKGKEDDYLSLNVKSIEAFNDRSTQYKKKNTPKIFGYFDIDYNGDKPYNKILIEQHEMLIYGGVEMIRRLDSVGDKVDCVGQKVEGVGQKVEGVGQKVEGVGQKVDCVGQKVDCVGQKVDCVGRKVEGVGRKVESMHDDMNKRFMEMNEKYHIISKELTESIKHLGRMNKSISRTLDIQEKAAENTDRLIEKLFKMIDKKKAKGKITLG